MIKFTSEREFRIVRDSFSAVKKINLKDIGFKQISDSNLYIYQSVNIKNLPNIFKELKLTIEVKIFPEEDVFKINRHISLVYESKNKLITFISDNFIDKILKNLIEIISIRFDKKLIKKVLKAI